MKYWGHLRVAYSQDQRALKIAGIYLLTGAIWILFSNMLLQRFLPDRSLLTSFNVINGWLFVLLTAFLLYRFVRRETAAIRAREESQARLEDTLQRYQEGIAAFASDRGEEKEKKAERALRASEARYQELLESIQDGLIQFDWDWRFTFINARAAQTVDREPHTLLGRNLWETFPAILGTDQERLYRQVMDTRQSAHTEARGFMSQRWYDFSVYPAQEGISLFLVDITERKHAEEEVRSQLVHIELQRRLLEQREEERLKIARDLHDGPVQELTGAHYALEGVLHSTDDENLAQGLRAIRDTIKNQVSELRAYAGQLRPPALVKFGLAPGIRSHLDAFQEKYPQIAVEFVEDIQDSSLVPDQQRLAIFRIFQEAIVNIAKHSQASKVQIAMVKGADQVRLEIQDNGRGFEVPEDWLKLIQEGHLGLAGMRERAEAIGGQLIIQSAKREGTRLEISVPLPRPGQAAESLSIE
jgi:PAS domain S-box-containing protein